MRLATITLTAALLASAAFNVSQWAASGLPIAAESGSLIATTSAGGVDVFGRGSPCEAREMIPLLIQYSAPLPGNDGPISFVRSDDVAATLNVDGTWSVAPVALLRYAWHTGFDPRDIGVRALLAYPVLRTASMEHGREVNSHFCQKDS